MAIVAVGSQCLGAAVMDGQSVATSAFGWRGKVAAELGNKGLGVATVGSRDVATAFMGGQGQGVVTTAVGRWGLIAMVLGEGCIAMSRKCRGMCVEAAGR